MVKWAMIKIADYLKEHNLKSRMIFSVHDEIVYEIYEGEEHIIKDLQAIQQEATWCTIPMISEIMFTNTNWAEKKDWREDMDKVEQLQLPLDFGDDEDIEEEDFDDEDISD